MQDTWCGHRFVHACGIATVQANKYLDFVWRWKRAVSVNAPLSGRLFYLVFVRPLYALLRNLGQVGVPKINHMN